MSPYYPILPPPPLALQWDLMHIDWSSFGFNFNCYYCSIVCYYCSIVYLSSFVDFEVTQKIILNEITKTLFLQIFGNAAFIKLKVP